MKTFNEIKEDARSRYIIMKFRVKNDLRRMTIWCRNNPEYAFVIATSVVGLIKFGGKTVIKRGTIRKQENVKNLYCYDRSLGHYWRLKRELSNREWVEIDKRKRSGEKLADILDEMKVLK